MAIYSQLSLAKKQMEIFKERNACIQLSLCIYNQILGLLQHFVSSCRHACMD